MNTDIRQNEESTPPPDSWINYILNHAKESANADGIAFNLSREDILSIITDTCPIFLTRFTFDDNEASESPCLDIIDPDKGYVEGNVQFISVKASGLKTTLGSREPFRFGEWIRL